MHKSQSFSCSGVASAMVPSLKELSISFLVRFQCLGANRFLAMASGLFAPCPALSNWIGPLCYTFCDTSTVAIGLLWRRRIDVWFRGDQRLRSISIGVSRMLSETR